MNKIEIITPVHIGTGEIIEAPCFYREKDEDIIAKRYLVTDILSQMPTSILTSPVFLRQLASKQKNKNELYKNINHYVNYSDLKELYTVKDDNEKDISESGYDVFEQIKDLKKPYIPGSSIKGALLNAWFYFLLKLNFDKLGIEKNIDRILSSRNFDKSTIINYLFKDELDHTKFIKALQSCLVCRDIYFNQMEVLWAERLGSGKEMKGPAIPISYRECIQPNQCVNSEFMYIDEYKKSVILKDITSYVSKNLNEQDRNKVIKRYETILSAFKQSFFYSACNAFTQDVLNEDCTPKYKSIYNFYCCKDINAQVDSLLKEIDNAKKNKEKVAYLRIGNSTNYFSKTITLLIRNQAPGLYYKYFDRVLSPNSSLKSNTRANKDTMPKTRTIYSSYDRQYLPGFIKIYYD